MAVSLAVFLFYFVFLPDADEVPYWCVRALSLSLSLSRSLALSLSLALALALSLVSLSLSLSSLSLSLDSRYLNICTLLVNSVTKAQIY